MWLRYKPVMRLGPELYPHNETISTTEMDQRATCHSQYKQGLTLECI
jgi:hypothetical protein